jgi:hypothetical protein
MTVGVLSVHMKTIINHHKCQARRHLEGEGNLNVNLFFWIQFISVSSYLRSLLAEYFWLHMQNDLLDGLEQNHYLMHKLNQVLPVLSSSSLFPVPSMHTHPTRTWKLRGISSFTTYLSPSGSA